MAGGEPYFLADDLQPFHVAVKKPKTWETTLAIHGEQPPPQPPGKSPKTPARKTAAAPGADNPEPPKIRANWSFRYPDCSSPGRYVTEKLAVDERGEFFTVSAIKETDSDCVLKFGHTTILKDDIRTVRFESRYGDPSWDALGMATKVRVSLAIVGEFLVILLTRFTRCSWRCCCRRRDVTVGGTKLVQYVPVIFVLGPALSNAAKGVGGGLPKLLSLIAAVMNPLTWMQILAAFMCWQLWWAFPRFDHDKDHYDMEQKMDQSRLAMAMLIAIFEVLVMFPLTWWWMRVPLPCCNFLENKGCVKRCETENLRKLGGIESGAVHWCHRILVLCFGLWMFVVISLLPWAADWNQVCLSYREYACTYPREWANLYPSLDAPADYYLHPALLYDECNPTDEVVEVVLPVVFAWCEATLCGEGELLILPPPTCNSTECGEDDDCCVPRGRCLHPLCNTTAWFPMSSQPQYCAGVACTPEECCDPAPSCSASDCPDGYVPALYPEEYCSSLECTRQECCEPVDVCKEVDCIAGALVLDHVDSARLQAGAAGRNCSSRSCTVDECCELISSTLTTTSAFTTTSTSTTPVSTTTDPAATTVITTTTTTTTGPLVCSESVCGYGWNLRPIAAGRSCNAPNRCTIAECCDRAGDCADHNCTDPGAVIRSDAEPCASTTCTDMECCGPPDFCSQSTCPGDRYVLKYTAVRPPSCMTDQCTITECCDTRDVCTHSDCLEPGLVLMAEDDLPTYCGTGSNNFLHCTTEECCVAVGTCDGYVCSDATMLKDRPDACVGIECENSECCEARGTCSERYRCTEPGVRLQVVPEFCSGSSCTDADCCGEADVCDESVCDGPYVLMQTPPNACNTDVCHRAECCVQTCSEMECGTGYIYRLNESDIGCAGYACSRAMDLETCCLAADRCEPSDCFLPEGVTFNVPDDVRGVTSPIVLRRTLDDFCPSAACSADDCCAPVTFCNFDGVLQADGTLTESSTDHANHTNTICRIVDGQRPMYRPYPEQPPVPCVRDECLVEECCVPSREGEVLGDDCCAAIGDEICGVGGCRCDPMRELSCRAPPECGEREVTAEPTVSAVSRNSSNFDGGQTICVSQPMCAVGPAGDTNASEGNWPILIVGMCTSIGLAILFCSWLLLTTNIFLQRFRRDEDNVSLIGQRESPEHAHDDDDMPMPTSKARVKILYQRFVVVFAPWPWHCQCRRRERNCVFRLGADVDPELVAQELLLRRPLAIAAKRFPGYHLPGERSANAFVTASPMAAVNAGQRRLSSPELRRGSPKEKEKTGTPKVQSPQALPPVSLDKKKNSPVESKTGIDEDSC